MKGMPQTVIRRLNKKKDILEVFSVFKNRFFSLQKGEEYCEALARKYEENAEFLTLYYDEKLAAFVAFYCNDEKNKTAYLSLIAVLERYEGRGFGGVMLDKAIEISRENGMKKILLEVREANERAVSMYQKKGFQPAKSKYGYMLVMSRDL